MNMKQRSGLIYPMYGDWIKGRTRVEPGKPVRYLSLWPRWGKVVLWPRNAVWIRRAINWFKACSEGRGHRVCSWTGCRLRGHRGNQRWVFSSYTLQRELFYERIPVNPLKRPVKRQGHPPFHTGIRRWRGWNLATCYTACEAQIRIQGLWLRFFHDHSFYFNILCLLSKEKKHKK